MSLWGSYCGVKEIWGREGEVCVCVCGGVTRNEYELGKEEGVEKVEERRN